MTARSSATKSDFLKYFTYKLKNLKSLIILNSVFAFLSYPALSIVSVFCINARNRFFESDDIYSHGKLWAQYDLWDSVLTMFAMVAFVAVVGLFFTGLPILMKNFRYLYDKRYVDMDISLPVSDNERFFGDFLSGLMAYTIPHILAIGIGAFVISICPPVFDDGTKTYIPLAEMSQDKIPLMNLFLQLSFIGLLSCLLFYCLNLAVVSFCGRGAEARLTIIVVNIALPLLAFTLVELSRVYYYGVADASDSTSVFTSGAVSLLSPLGMLCSTAVSWLMTSVRTTEAYVFTPLRDFGWLVAIIACIAYVAIAYFLMKKRHNERVGSPYMFKGIRHIVSAVVSLSVFSVSIISDVLMSNAQWRSSYYSDNVSVNFVNHIPAFVITLIIFIIMELISGKGFKKFHFTLLRYVGCCAGSIIICLLLLNSKGFGAEYYVPHYNDVEAVAVSYSQGNRISQSYKVDNIEEITELHRAFITDRVTNHVKENSGSNGQLSIDYRLKNGEVVTRHYYDADSAYIDDIARICIEKGNGVVNEYAPIDDISKVTEISVYNEYNKANGSYSETKVNIPPEKLFDAMKKDAMKITFDDIYHSSRRNRCIPVRVTWSNAVYGAGSQINVAYNGVGRFDENYYIYESFENTIKLFADYGVSIEIDDTKRDNCKIAIIMKGKSDYFVDSYLGISDILNNYYYSDSAPQYEKIRFADISSPDFKEIYDNSGYTVYYGEPDRDIYYVTLISKNDYYEDYDFYTYRGVVFPEYTEKAEAYWNSLPNADKETVDELLGINKSDN